MSINDIISKNEKLTKEDDLISRSMKIQKIQKIRENSERLNDSKRSYQDISNWDLQSSNAINIWNLKIEDRRKTN